MKELQNIIQAFDTAHKKGQRTALATVVKVEGSSYRRAGARMLVTDDGQLTGAISGGCLEGDALRKAQLAMESQQTLLITYDTTDEDDTQFGVQLGCNGIVHILIEPIIAEQDYHPVELLKRIVGTRQTAVLVTVFAMSNRHQPQPGTCLLLTEGDELYSRKNELPLNSKLSEEACEALQQGHSLTKDCDGYTIFFELIKPPLSLIIVGAGNDAIPLAKIADQIGWKTTVVDGRPHYVSRLRFPTACTLLVAKPDEVLSKVTVDDQTALVLMTHNYNYDLGLLRHLLPLQLPYVGILGPKKRMHRMLDELNANGFLINEEWKRKIYAPVGLNIGAETPEEIALAIASEILAAFTHTSARFLREKPTPIHQP